MNLNDRTGHGLFVQTLDQLVHTFPHIVLSGDNERVGQFVDADRKGSFKSHFDSRRFFLVSGWRRAIKAIIRFRARLALSILALKLLVLGAEQVTVNFFETVTPRLRQQR